MKVHVTINKHPQLEIFLMVSKASAYICERCTVSPMADTRENTGLQQPHFII
jgi:hypothetical protein